MNVLQNFFGHLHTVNQHRLMVCKLCFKCGLYRQGLTHDLSKFSPVEFFNGVRFYTGTCSPHVGERAKYGYSKAWLHHKGHNKHHGEYWQDIGSDGFSHTIPMPPKFFAEMLCDRIAASMIYLRDNYTDHSPLEYYLSRKDENQFHKDTKQALYEWLVCIAEEGTNATLQKLKCFIFNKEIK